MEQKGRKRAYDRTDIGEEIKRRLLINNTVCFYRLDVNTRQSL